MSSQAVTYLTPEQYLEIERKADYKSEYLNGEMFSMAGATLRHNRLIVRTAMALDRQTRGGPCEVFLTDLRLFVPSTGLYTYPDIMVICGSPALAGDQEDMVTNPKLIIEVLSDSTKNYDRGEKFRHYRSIPDFSEYLLIAQDEVRVERHVRQPDGSWVFREFGTMGDLIELTSIGCNLSVAAIYEDVEN